jgi:hypothetical protein
MRFTQEGEEETVNRIEPPLEPRNTGMRTYSFSNGFEIADVKRDAWARHFQEIDEMSE